MDKLPKKYFFIDESGDASFYAKGKKLLVPENGFQSLLIIGMVIIEDKNAVHQSLVEFRSNILDDILYNSLPCITKTSHWYLHARNDQLEIRTKFFEFLRSLQGFKSYAIIGRKKLSRFETKHNSNESEFYFDLIYHMLKDRMNDDSYFYQIILSTRNGNNADKLKAAVTKAIERDNNIRKVKLNIKFDCRTAQSQTTPELSIVDYMLWALQRYIITGESRFYKALEEKYNLIIDLYDTANFKTNYYNSKNRFDLKKASPFKRDGR